MALQFVLGDLKQNKKAIIIKHLHQKIQDNPNLKIFYLVPEHLKFEMESFVLEQFCQLEETADASMINFQVASFSRLGWFLFKEGSPGQSLSDLGLSMLVRQLLDQHQKKLQVYQKQIRHQSFNQALVDLFKEFIQGQIKVEDLYSDSEKLDHPINDLEKQKQKEIQFLYGAFLQGLNDLKIDNFAQVEKLVAYLDQADLDNFLFVIDHYYYFNSLESQLLLSIAKQANLLYLLLPIARENLYLASEGMTDRLIRKTYFQIKDLTQQLGIRLEKDWEIKEPNLDFDSAIIRFADRFKAQQDLRPLADNEVHFEESQESHYFLQFDSIQSELCYVANRIHYLVQQKGYRYKDFKIFTRDLSTYQAIVDPILSMNQIPYFFDHAKAMTDHPLYDFLLLMMHLYHYQWRLVDIKAIIKSPMIDWNKLELTDVLGQDFDYDHLIYQFENYIIANGYDGYRFYRLDYQWYFGQEDQAYRGPDGQTYSITYKDLYLALRQYLVIHLYWRDDSSLKRSVQEMGLASLFYQELDRLGIQERLIFLRDQAIEIGRIEESRQHEQVWQVLMQILEEFDQLYGKSWQDLSVFFDIIKAGMGAATYHIIPPTLDQVTFTNILSPQVQACRVAFIIGMDHRALPAQQAYQDLLSPDHRRDIQERLSPQQFLTDRMTQSNQAEYLLAYQVFLLAKEKLYFTFAANKGTDQSQQVSPWIKQAAKTNGYQFIRVDSMAVELAPLYPIALGTYFSLRSVILYQLRQAMVQNLPTSTYIITWLQCLLNWEEEKGIGQHRILDLLEGSFYFHQLPQAIDPDLAKQLFGFHLNLSVSRVEQFYKDPYAHFLSYGLRLQERQVFEMDPAKMGDYFHQALDHLIQDLRQKGKQLQDLSLSQAQLELKKILAQLSEHEEFASLSRHPRMLAVRELVNHRLQQFLEVYYHQVQSTKAQNVATEWIFDGRQFEDLASFIYRLPSGGTLSIRGKIDRIDKINYLGQDYLQVIDYKSGAKEFSLVDAYYGIDLQILTYLAVAAKKFPDAGLLGAFYQPIIPKFYLVKDQFVSADPQLQRLELLSERRLSGFVTLASDRLQEIEGLDIAGKKSVIYPVSYKKDGTYSAYSHYIDSPYWQAVLDHVNHCFIEAGQAIQEGQIQLAPYYDDAYAMSLSPQYRVITGFDGSQSFEAYRHKTVKNKEVLDLLLSKGSEQYDSHS